MNKHIQKHLKQRNAHELTTQLKACALKACARTRARTHARAHLSSSGLSSEGRDSELLRWSSCSSMCGQGFRTRNVSCSSGGQWGEVSAFVLQLEIRAAGCVLFRCAARQCIRFTCRYPCGLRLAAASDPGVLLQCEPATLEGMRLSLPAPSTNL